MAKEKSAMSFRDVVRSFIAARYCVCLSQDFSSVDNCNEIYYLVHARKNGATFRYLIVQNCETHFVCQTLSFSGLVQVDQTDYRREQPLHCLQPNKEIIESAECFK